MAGVGEMGKQTVEERGVTIGRDLQMQVGEVRAGRTARIDIDDTHVGPRGLGRRDALVQDRVAPREVGANQHDQIGLFEIFIGAGNGVRAKGAFVTSHRRGHAKP